MEYRIKGNVKEVEHHVDLWLTENEACDCIELRARHSSWPDHRGSFHIIRIYEDGTVKASRNVDEILGFKLDCLQRVRIE